MEENLAAHTDGANARLNKMQKTLQQVQEEVKIFSLQLIVLIPQK